MHSFAKKTLKITCMQPVKKMCTFLAFLNYTSGYLKFCKYFCYLKWLGLGPFKNVYFIIFFCKRFPFFNGFCLKILIFANLQIFFKILKVEHNRFAMMYVSFVIFGHQTWDLEGGGHLLVFQVPQQG